MSGLPGRRQQHGTRRHQQQQHGCRMQTSRMYFCWIMLTSLAIVMGDSNQLKGTFFPEGKKLRLECPPDKDNKFLAVYLRRLGNNSPVLADWMPNRDSGARSSSSDPERVQVDNTDDTQLVAVLSDVTCLDSATYECTTTEQKDNRQTKYTYPFTYIGDITQPFLNNTALKARYMEGEFIRLNCSARIGVHSNRIVWEIKRQNDSKFVRLNEALPAVSITEYDPTPRPGDCTVYSTSRLHYGLTRGDDGAVFQCRLKDTNHSSRTAVALACADQGGEITVGASSRIVTGRGRSPGRGGEATNPLGTGQTDGDVPRASYVKMEEGDDSGSTSDPTLVVVIVVAVVVVVVVLVALALVKRHTDKRPQPLVVLDSPPPSEDSYSDRRLPHLPHLALTDQRLPRRHGSLPPLSASSTRAGTLTSTSSLHTTRYVDSPLSSALLCLAPQGHPHPHQKEEDDPNVSVYVSMTGLDCLGKDPPPPQASGPAPSSFADGSTSVFSDYSNDLDPDMREDRSESIYSNEGRHRCAAGPWSKSNGIGSSNNGSNDNGRCGGGVDSDVTRLKIVD
ncbi:uncharacterized protein LOC143296385 isoform X2 [Babylonia areolata]|uniref:uncharacterized protein LOC143296385 isoform X2 n=1 Tax=Babylonia areolata TaxID=304850 RepID=UPI003FD34581